jgi:DNA-binding NarL/FixJ family response regulator
MKSPPPEKQTVVLVEDHAMFREQLGHLIERSGEMVVAAEADNIADGFEAIQNAKPSVAIIDITLRGANGLELLKQLRAAGIDVPVLVLSMHDESLYAERALRSGARGYVTKHEASATVMQAIRQVLRGEIYLNPRFMSQLASRMIKRPDGSEQPIDRLADRELEVFELIGRGLTTREIGEQLGLGTASVDTYTARIKDKLKLENTARLRVEASRWVQQRE